MAVEKVFYCLKGRHKVKLTDYKLVKTATGQRRYSAVCPTHKNKLSLMAPKQPGDVIDTSKRKKRRSKKSRKSRKSKKGKGKGKK